MSMEQAMFPGCEQKPRRNDTPKGSISFFLPCIPTAQQRARHMTKGGFHRAYKSAAQEANERTLEALLAPLVPDEPMTGALQLSFRAIFPVPKSASKRDRVAMLRGTIGHTTKPDLDNLAKQLKDAMTRMLFWGDDRQVTRCVCAKEYGEAPGWAVAVSRIADARK